MTGPRGQSLRLLVGVLEQHRAFEDLFETVTERLETRDKALVRRLAATTLRRFGQAEALIGRLLDRGPLPARLVALRALLAQGATELVFLGTPAHAAIDCAVQLAHDTPALSGHAGLVNAVLRRLAREALDAGAADVRAPVTLNTPAWLASRWRAYDGPGAPAAFAQAHVTEPALDITVKTDPLGWAERLDAVVLPTGSLRRPVGGRIEELPGFAEGAWWVQDAAAALPARLFGEVAGQNILDLCAAPGGKTAQLAAAGAHVTALDRDAGRLTRLDMNLRRLGLAADFIAADATDWTPSRRFPLVLLDAPCSATGTIRRHPDIPFLKRESDITALAVTQARLLDTAAAALAPGGALVYAVCSLEPEEGVDQIEALLRRDPSLARAPIHDEALPGITSFITAKGDLRTTPDAWPQWGGLDGFFTARLRRRD